MEDIEIISRKDRIYSEQPKSISSNFIFDNNNHYPIDSVI